MKDTLSCGRAVPNQKELDFRAVSATACWGIENCKELFGLVNDKEAISAAFEAGTGENKKNLLFGSSSFVSRMLDHWRELLDDAFKLIESPHGALQIARRHRKRLAKRRGLKANELTPS